MHESWFSGFFQGTTLDVWKDAMTPETTADEAAFIANNLSTSDGAKLLDVPCGNGRLSLMLAEMGFKPTGIDSSEQFIVEARNNAVTSGIEADQFQLGDMRELPWNNEFAGAFCFGNSFGFFDSVESLKFLRAVNKSLVSGSRFILDTLMVAESFLTNGGQREWQLVGDRYMLVQNDYDCQRSIVQSTYTYFDKAGTGMHTAVAYYHIFTSGQICSMLAEAGFNVVNLFGSIDEEPFQLGSPRLLAVAEKR
jgi:hypothetical protein